jgi:hypothetical protein
MQTRHRITDPPCLHIFHLECIDMQLLRNHGICPNCRAPMPGVRPAIGYSDMDAMGRDYEIPGSLDVEDDDDDDTEIIVYDEDAEYAEPPPNVTLATIWTVHDQPRFSERLQTFIREIQTFMSRRDQLDNLAPIHESERLRNLEDEQYFDRCGHFGSPMNSPGYWTEFLDRARAYSYRRGRQSDRALPIIEQQFHAYHARVRAEQERDRLARELAQSALEDEPDRDESSDYDPNE